MTGKQKRDRAANIGDEALDLEPGLARDAFIELRSEGDGEMVQLVRDYLSGGAVTAEESGVATRLSGAGQQLAVRIDRYQILRELAAVAWVLSTWRPEQTTSFRRR